MVNVICKLSCESKYLESVIKNANDEIAVYGAEISILKEFPKEKQQPSVPVQFVVASNMGDEDTELLTNALSGEKTFFCGDAYEVEQIGAVLYVRGK